jgi:hypothetical protein
MSTTYEEGVDKLNNLTLKAIDLIDRRISYLHGCADMQNSVDSEYAAKEAVKIIKVIPKLLYVLQQVKAMQKEIEAQKEREEKKYDKGDLLVIQNYVNKLISEYDEKPSDLSDSIAA